MHHVRRGVRALSACVIGVVLMAWCVGLAIFLSGRRKFVTTLPVQKSHPAQYHNLAAALSGPTVRASSYIDEVYPQHHPTFVVDGRNDPTRLEKWASAPSDRSPWIEISWNGTHEVESVNIRHAGSLEDPRLTAREYKILCLPRGTGRRELAVTGNEASLAVHPFECAGSNGIRIQFVPNAKGDSTRVYEVEVWGR